MAGTKNVPDAKYEDALDLARRQYLLQIHETWIHIQKLVRVYSFIGLLLATGFGIAAYVLFSPSMCRLIFMSAAMGALSSAAIGINIVFNLSQKKNVPFILYLIFLATIIAFLLALFIKGKENGVSGLWPPLGSALYSSIMVGIVWRLRATAREFAKVERLVNTAPTE